MNNLYGCAMRLYLPILIMNIKNNTSKIIAQLDMYLK